MRTFVIGDIHGQYDKLVKCLELAQVNDNDTIIQLGDIVDRGPDPFACIDLLKKWNTIFIRGNHEEEFIECYLRNNNIHFGGQHGSMDIIKAWQKLDEGKKKIYMMFFLFEMVDYYVDDQKRCFVHGGFNRHYPIAEQSKLQYYFDRDLLTLAYQFESMKHEDGNLLKFKIKDKFKEIYVGHTPTTYFGIKTPMGPLCKKVWNLDTGSGKGGLLTIMNIDTKQYWQA